MRKSDEILAQIQSLQKEYEKAKLEEKQILLWSNDTELYSSNSPDVIGFFRLDKARIILTALNNGEALLIKHSRYNYKVNMNYQKNRILVESTDKSQFINEKNIMEFIVWGSGDWYILNEE